jgi:hypothetical protein
MPALAPPKPVSVAPLLRWAARIWAALAFCFWGMFFVEHLQEWHFGGKGVPPLFVSALLAAHFLYLFGLAIGWKWELTGALVVLASATAFFTNAGGANAATFLVASAFPAVIWLWLAGYEVGRRASRS